MTDLDHSFDIYVSLLKATGEYARSGKYGCPLSAFDRSLSLMDAPPCGTLIQYLSKFVPDVEVGPGHADFLTADKINLEHSGYIPSCGSIKCGLFTFASAGDGAAYALSNRDQMVYLLPVGRIQNDSVQFYSSKPTDRPLTHENVTAVAEMRWPSLLAFFLWLENAVST